MGEEHGVKKWVVVFLMFFCLDGFSQELIPLRGSGKNIRYALIVSNNTRVYERSEMSSKEIASLNILEMVGFEQVTNVLVSNRKKKWYRIKLNTSGALGHGRGWVQEGCLIGKSQFNRVNLQQEMFITVGLGDSQTEYHFYQNGTFLARESSYDPEVGGSTKEFKGFVYQYQNIFTPDFYEYFYMDAQQNVKAVDVDYIEVITNQTIYPF